MDAWLPSWLPAISDVLSVGAFCISFAFNMWSLGRYFAGSFYSVKFFSGRWQGELTSAEGILKCVAVFYEQGKQLSGQLYYEGQYGDRDEVRGFDILLNNSANFQCIDRAYKVVPRGFTLKFHRALHSFRMKGSGLCEIDINPQFYDYEFKIHTRFGSPRLTCGVMSQPDEEGNVYGFSGELRRQ